MHVDPTHQLARQTIQDFGDQWTRYRDNDGYYASSTLLADIVEPLLPVAAVEGKRVADIGSGTGRIVNMLLQAGAAHVVAVEPSDAFHVLRANVVRPADVTLLHTRGEQLPASADLDLAFSIGVLHHIPDPLPVLRATYAALRPGGRMLAWLYGREGNGIYLALAQPLRALTRRLPHPLLAGLVHLLYPALAGYIALARRFDVPLHDYLNNYLARLSPAQRRLVMYDQLNPAYAKYYRRDEARALFHAAGFHNVRTHHRHGYSWTVIGEKPRG
jgi:SAM-dependent methyltransferase